ncbi:glycoside hydrolase family 32 protein [Corynebacterium uberis]|uniref:glycoside hydrolase family 32 protein n=1 Tax=Corynebacterium TaxID=1716 RepID=UPI001D09ACAA|nr:MULTISPECIES: glycoside hydrolase family 32 protein [Corynebacterium]MCZ9309832.1 glycoside hydrolase family 32 protein [Corynebacterium sp. c6VSa_13]UDL73238.1 glycoside hydrolase family 32 protein [Corynebacterium uberis]UDL75885.1 glycoside hydrolase family 32 protein [Corynebacterium uberis]UDL78097.1 glycoside hydrolase family 32 protein [Corynebacterium uberis]UDL82515.1 glycoside hydrolase family 32 protein [Corynebacterium uberis]
MTAQDNSNQAVTHAQRLAAAQEGNRRGVEKRNDRWYPRHHIAAPAGWINDPNGLCHFQGRYHVYFQHHPFSDHWGPMHWGHVSSTDMVTWRREPIALAPSLEEDRDGVFSGSAIERSDGTLAVFYTGHRWRNGVNEDDGNLQVQCLATSTDGVTFDKRGVVVDCPEGLKHFRDPKVFAHDGRYYMVFGACSADNRGQVWMYVSDDPTLERWEFDRVVYQDPNPDVFMLECPDMFPLGDHWVIAYCPMGLAPRGHDFRNDHTSGYIVGDWQPGQDFRPLGDFQPSDAGHNFYAPQTFRAPDGRRIQYAWMGSFTHESGPQLGGDGWTGQLTVPRELTLDPDTLRLVAQPIAELTPTRTPVTLPLADAPVADLTCTLQIAGGSAQRAGLTIAGAYLYYDAQTSTLGLDLRTTGAGERGYRALDVADLVEREGCLRLRVIIDHGSIEVYLPDGRSLTSCVFPADGPRPIDFLSEGGEMELADVELGTPVGEIQ